MKHKNKVQFSILLSTFFGMLFSFGSVSAISPAISISTNDVTLNANRSERIELDTANFYGDITVSSSDTSIATAKLIGCESATSCSVRNKNVVMLIQGVSSGTTTTSVSFSGFINSQSMKIDETQNINVTVKSNDSSLSSLQVSPGSIDFSKDTTEYVLTLEHDVETVNITATATNNATTISGIGQYTLKDYLNTFTITAIAGDGSSTVYTINIKRKDSIGRTAASSKKSENNGEKSNDNTLVDILIPGYPIELEEDVTEYRITVNPDTESLMMRAVPKNSKAKVEITGNDNIEIGENLIKIAVIAENGEIKDYVIRVTRPSNEDAVLMSRNSGDNNVGVLGATTNGKSFNILPIILTVAGVFIAAGVTTTVIFLKKKTGAKRNQFNVMRVNSGFRPGAIR